jgi:hypothetical protein
MKLIFIPALMVFATVVSAQEATTLPDAPSFLLARAAAVRGIEGKHFDARADERDEWRREQPPFEAPAFSDADERGDEDGASASEIGEQGLRLDLGALFGKMDRPADGPIEVGVDGPVQQAPESYHWKGLLWESFAFFGVENTQRLLADSYFRTLTADRPFWHDYIASVGQWNWRRWDDGDDFLVAYIAHPLQGSVTEFIEIQNSPRNRNYRLNDGKAYWKSRMQSFYWATAYSFDQKLGPLGETALGSEGGYTYVDNCAYYCSAYFADPSRYKVTNNTGWVKLVSTPVVGTVWTVMEDAIDHLISDRVEGNRIHASFPKILRGSLNPSRTMANLLRWRVPWYRDWEHDGHNVYLTPTTRVLPGDDEVILAAPKDEFFPHFNFISLPVNTFSRTFCRQKIAGYGFGYSRRIATYADLDSDVNLMSNASPLPSDRAGGDIVTATFGLKSGYTRQHFSVKAYLRPGFLSFDRAYEASPSSTLTTPPIGRITHFSVALGLDGDVYVKRHWGFRGVVGNQPVRYREAYTDPPGIGTYPYLNWLSKLYFLTNENWTYQMGTVVRF